MRQVDEIASLFILSLSLNSISVFPIILDLAFDLTFDPPPLTCTAPNEEATIYKLCYSGITESGIVKCVVCSFEVHVKGEGQRSGSEYNEATSDLAALALPYA